MLQRRLRIGYSRAARLVEMMEQQGISLEAILGGSLSTAGRLGELHPVRLANCSQIEYNDRVKLAEARNLQVPVEELSKLREG